MGTFRPGTVALFAGTVGEFKRQPPAHAPRVRACWTTTGDRRPRSSPGRSSRSTRPPRTCAPGRSPTCIGLALDALAAAARPDARRRCGPSTALMDLDTALREIHRPASWAMAGRRPQAAEVGRGVRRAGLAGAAQAAGRGVAGGPAAAPAPDGLLATFDATLPYTLTEGQVAVGEEIAADLAAAHPMHRLLQGEVGSGKTAVRAAGDAAGGRRRRPGGACSPRPRCWPRSTTAASGTCSARWGGPASSTAPSRRPRSRW